MLVSAATDYTRAENDFELKDYHKIVLFRFSENRFKPTASPHVLMTYENKSSVLDFMKSIYVYIYLLSGGVACLTQF